MATSNPYFNPLLEMLRAAGQNGGNFLMHPGLQSQRAAQAAQDLFMNQANAMRPDSPLQPYMRPGVAQDSPEALSAEQLQLMQKRGLLAP